MKKIILLTLLSIPFRAMSQEMIRTTDGQSISCQIRNVSSQLIKFVNSTNLKEDSIAASNVKEIIFKDATKILVYPSSQRDQVTELDENGFRERLSKMDYGSLLHSKVTLGDISYIENSGYLTNEAKQKLRLLFIPLTGKPMSLDLTIYTDTLRKTTAKVALQKAKAASLKAHLVSLGLNADKISVKGVAENEIKAGTFNKNNKAEVRILKIDKISVLYSEEYIAPKIQAEEKVVEAIAGPVSKDVILESPVKEVKPKRGLPISFTAGPEAGQILGGDSNYWSSKDGIGFLRNVGVSMNINYALNKKIEVVINAGFSKTSVTKKYLTEEVLQFSTVETLSRIPVQLGVRLYLLGGFYIQPMIGGQKFKITSVTKDAQVDEEASYSSSSNGYSYGGYAGYQFRFGKLLVDLSGHYSQINSTKGFYGASSSMPVAGIRLGVGFDFKNKTL